MRKNLEIEFLFSFVIRILPYFNHDRNDENNITEFLDKFGIFIHLNARNLLQNYLPFIYY